MSNSTGKAFVVTTFGESHGPAVGAVVDGCPAGIELTEADIQPQLDRRRPGQSALTTGRSEPDSVRILSGTDNGITLGSPIALLVANTNTKSADYRQFADIPRPSHADLTQLLKYGIIASSGGGRASARETVARVAAGAVAQKALTTFFDIGIVAWTSSIGTIDAPDLTDAPPTRAQVDANRVRCPCEKTAIRMISEIEFARDDADSVGGIVTCVCTGVPAGWGNPVFDKLSATLAAAMMSIPAAKGFDIGSGFNATRMRGSEHNDMFVVKNDVLGTATNRSGGIQGGITNGEPIVFRVAFKPTASIARPQQTVDFQGNRRVLEAHGRHDPCVVPRAVPVVEAMAAIILADAAMSA